MAERQESWARYLDVDTRKSPPSGFETIRRTVPGLTLLYHPDVRRIGERVTLPELASGREVTVSRVAPEFSAPGHSNRRPLADPYLSRRPVRLRPDARRGILVQTTDTSITVSLGGASIEGEVRVSSQEVERGVILVLAERFVLLLHHLLASPPSTQPFGLVGESPAIVQVRREIEQVAELAGAVLVRGETGTGKELVARAIHRASPRAALPYQAVNMGAIPTELAAAELFGASRGAFTGADRKRLGLFQSCHEGTLFLDEIGETPPQIQVALLRVLEEGEIHPLGSEKTQPVDVRVIAATDANLEEMIAKGLFRAPLWHRLSGLEVTLPALRHRKDDIGRLLIHFLTEELETVGMSHLLADSGPDNKPWLAAPVMAWLSTQDWPGNVRQLRNVARQLVAGCRHDPEAHITPAIERLLGRKPSPKPPRPQNERPVFRHPEEVSEEELIETLKANRWRLLPCAAQLGISRTALYGLIARFPNVRKSSDLDRAEIESCQQRCRGDLEAMVDELQVSRKGLRRRMTELGIP